MLTPDGFVKILDFGLAKLHPDAVPGTAPSDEGKSDSPTTFPTGTRDGAIIGTVGYMSPEQAAGRPADYRADQFALGATLYEMATGRQAFSRGSVVQTLNAIIEDDPPPLAELNPSFPAPAQVDRRTMPGEGSRRALRIDARPGARTARRARASERGVQQFRGAAARAGSRADSRAGARPRSGPARPSPAGMARRRGFGGRARIAAWRFRRFASASSSGFTGCPCRPRNALLCCRCSVLARRPRSRPHARGLARLRGGSAQRSPGGSPGCDRRPSGRDPPDRPRRETTTFGPAERDAGGAYRRAAERAQARWWRRASWIPASGRALRTSRTQFETLQGVAAR